MSSCFPDCEQSLSTWKAGHPQSGSETCCAPCPSVKVPGDKMATELVKNLGYFFITNWQEGQVTLSIDTFKFRSKSGLNLMM